MSCNSRFLIIIVLVAVIGFFFIGCPIERTDAYLIFYDEFNGTTLDKNKWDLCPEWLRHDRSSWRDDMVEVSGGYLHLKFRRDPELGEAELKKENKDIVSDIKNNWLRAGAVRTRTKDHQTFLFSHSFGYYEARIKFPVVSGTWGAFWLMTPTQNYTENGGRDGTEIDIIESIRSNLGEYNAALHWNGYGEHHQKVGSSNRPVNIYDGNFHIFALEWTPTEYVFYIDGIEFWRVDGGPLFNNVGINQTANYIKLSVESAIWAGSLPVDFTKDVMLVDYVRVYNRKP